MTDYNDISDLDDDDELVIQPLATNTASLIKSANEEHNNLIVNHHFEPNDYFEMPVTSLLNYQNIGSNQNSDSDYMTDSYTLNTFNYNSSSSNNFNQNENISLPIYANLTSSTNSSLAQTLSVISSANFVEANNFNISSFNLAAPSLIIEQEEKEQEEVAEKVFVETQPSTSSAVVKKRGRPADSPGTKIRKAAEKSNKNKKPKNS